MLVPKGRILERRRVWCILLEAAYRVLIVFPLWLRLQPDWQSAVHLLSCWLPCAKMES